MTGEATVYHRRLFPGCRTAGTVSKGRSAAFVFFVLLVGAAVALAWGFHRFRVQPLDFPQATLRFTVPPGAHVRGVARALREQGVGIHPAELWFWYKLRGLDGKIKSGTYELAAPMTIDALLGKLVRGDVLIIPIRFIEGWTFRQMRAVIDAEPELRHDTRDLSEAEILQRIGASGERAEGLFFPDTYLFSPGLSDLDIYRRAHDSMQRVLDEAWSARQPDLPYRTPHDALVLASIIEKETGLESERTRIAAVFVNRLRRGMMLQSDPTTIYGMGERFDGNLRKRDLQADTEYNTYTRAGLPPTPIALPGRASITAALQPAQTRALYFVARGDGSSEFSADLASHNRAVSRYQRGGR